jgi:hypothetical protein
LFSSFIQKSYWQNDYIFPGDAFSGTALFYLGLSLVGKISGQMGPQLIIPVLLIAAKA